MKNTEYSRDDVRNMLRRQFSGDDYGRMKTVAREHGVSASYISAVIHGHFSPGPKILRILGLRKRTIFEPIPRR